MNALYLLTRGRSGATPGTPVGGTIAGEPLVGIRPGAFARWIAQVETEAAQAEASRGGSATNEGIAAARPEGLTDLA